MSVQLINGHVFFPHEANYQTLPGWKRYWENSITPAPTGDETRTGFRDQPLVELSWQVNPWSNIEQNQFEERLKKAKKCGKACAPYWGRASVLNADCTANTAVLKATPWPWAANDYIFFSKKATGHDASGAMLPNLFDVMQVQSVAGTTLTLTGNVSRTYPAGSLCWPLLFGKITTNDLAAATNRRGVMTLTIKELISSATKQIGIVPGAAGNGIGALKVGSTLIIG